MMRTCVHTHELKLHTLSDSPLGIPKSTWELSMTPVVLQKLDPLLQRQLWGPLQIAATTVEDHDSEQPRNPAHRYLKNYGIGSEA